MSSWIVSATDIDSIVSIAHHWTATGALDMAPSQVRELLSVTDENASEIGRRLWQANVEANMFGGPRAYADPEIVEEAEAEAAEDGGIPNVREYSFQKFPGAPHPATAMRRIGYYRYQTANDTWDDF
ncbi:MAG: hypothetical protein ABIR39_00565, partial [Nocardioides sp.]|uniref:hypothetical protein n=1 Tax=Nocardioides sp. TaxID=35761 RepID=UPI003263C742